MTDFRRVRFLGLLAGLAMSFMGGIGMIELFNNRIMIDPILRLGDLFFYGLVFLMGYLAAKGPSNLLEETVVRRGTGSLTGLVTGLIGGVTTAIFVLIVNSVDVTEFFPHMDQAMIDSLTFGLGIPGGVITMVIAAGLTGAFGGFVSSLPTQIRKTLTISSLWVGGFSLLDVVVADILEVRPAIRAIYAPSGGLRIWAAVGIAALSWWLASHFRGQVGQFNTRVRESDPKSRLRRSVIGLVVLSLIVLPMLLGGILNELMINVSLFILMGLGLNIVVGLAGLLDLGYVAFFAVGAYGTAVLTSPLSPTVNPELSWWLALPIVMGLAALAGLLVGTPVLRMRGDYLAIVTLGFGEIVRILLLSDWLVPLFGGSQGIRRIPGISVPFLGEVSGTDPQLFVYFAMVFVGLAAYISYRAQNSRVGRSWAAMREDESVAEAIGISTVQAKLLAFITGAVIASFAGALSAAKVGAVFTNSFDVLVSIVILVVVIVGGMGSIPGVMVGAAVMIGVLGGPKSPGLLSEFSEYKLLLYGVILVVMMLKRPEGLLPSVRRSRELHVDELEQDAWLSKGGDFGNEETAEAPT